jgi:phosphatidylinositol kinase/protein kinase (PI-3  family)
MFKKGDDLRQDILTLQLFKVMQNLWFDNGLHLKMSLYSVISTGFFQGMLHIVEQSETLAALHKMFGGATVPLFSNKPLREWLEKTSAVPKSDWELNFLLSCSAYCVATFVLGIGDRHNDNIMIKKVK